ncbi:MAG: type IV toxin-antitoxin system AbiEi family antitoxin [Candidatus Obscuribacterales bacterium]|nr:type IV toxin-antitoxin system AbiEi family antitoxin [Candidatus Obscuribacterales bacterium]
MSIMGIQRYKKLNQLVQILPEGMPVDSNWLQKKGYSRQLIAKYSRHGWLSSPMRGVYRRDSALMDPKSWEPVVISLQKLLEISITVGGRTALNLHGLSHYLPMNAQSEVHLYGTDRIPGWVNKLPLKQQLVFHSTKLFKSNEGCLNDSKAQQQMNFIDHKWGASEWTMLISTPERAILELLDELPIHETFHQADVLMDGLANLRPKYLNAVLADCRSVKTKRLFLWFAQRHNHAWFKLLDAEKIDIGKGKRMIVSGGKLDPKYLITVPDEFANDRQHTI